MRNRIIGIMSAMPEEIAGIELLMDHPEEVSYGMRTYFKGKIGGTDAVLVFSRWGKVAAATTVSTLILQFNITELIFTGVAGGMHPDLAIGDIVLGSRFIQHDMDARPILNQYELPLHGIVYLNAPETQLNYAQRTIETLLSSQALSREIGQTELSKFGISRPNLYTGDIASGDKFFSTEYDKKLLTESLPEVLCVEMEGAAVAQVCYEHAIPYTIIRTISDTADEKSPVDFPAFIENISSKYSIEMIRALFQIDES